MSPTEKLIDSHHQPIYATWNRPRFVRLAKLMRLSDAELGALCGLTRRQTQQAFDANAFSNPVCLHLQNIENYTMAELLGHVPTNRHALDYL